MATVRDTIELQDKMSPVLGTVIKSLKSTIAVIKKVDSSIDTASLNKVEKDIQAAENALLKFNNVLSDTPVKLNEISDKATKAFTGVSIFSSAAGGFISNVVTGAFDSVMQKAKDSIQYASDLVEVQNVVDTTFGQSAKQIDQWSSKALEAYGLNELSAKRFNGTLGAMLTSSGIANDKLVEMTTTLVGLAGDMASFYNLSGEQAFDKIRAGISGETEPLKQLGINMSTANLDAFALEKGLGKVYDKMSYAEQVTLRYQYLLSKTADAQGDFAKTADTYANQQRLFTETFGQTLALFAKNLLPILTAGMSAANSFMKFITKNFEAVNLAIMLSATILTAYYMPALMRVGIAQAKLAYDMAKGWAIANWPLLLVIGSVIALVMYLRKCGVEFGTMANYAGKAIGFLYAFFYNAFAKMYNIIIAFANFFMNVFNNPIDAAAKLFLDFADVVLGSLELIANGIDKVFGTGVSEAITNFRKDLQDFDALSKFGEHFDKMQYLSFDEQMKKFGVAAENFITGNNGEDLFGGINKFDVGPTGTATDPINTNVGNKVEISDESIRLMRDVARLEYVNKYTTLKPEMNVYISDVKETADIDAIEEKLAKRFQESVDAALDS